MTLVWIFAFKASLDLLFTSILHEFIHSFAFILPRRTQENIKQLLLLP